MGREIAYTYRCFADACRRASVACDEYREWIASVEQIVTTYRTDVYEAQKLPSVARRAAMDVCDQWYLMAMDAYTDLSATIVDPPPTLTLRMLRRLEDVHMWLVFAIDIPNRHTIVCGRARVRAGF